MRTRLTTIETIAERNPIEIESYTSVDSETLAYEHAFRFAEHGVLIQCGFKVRPDCKTDKLIRMYLN
jgi:hypothetical protein